MKRLELYFIRIVLILVLAAIAASPFLAMGHFLHGVFDRRFEGTHLLALGYLLLVALAFFLVSPIFSENKRGQRRPRDRGVSTDTHRL